MLESCGPGPLVIVNDRKGIYAKGFANPDAILHNIEEVMNSQQLCVILSSFHAIAKQYHDLECRLSLYEPGSKKYNLLKSFVERAKVKVDGIESKISNLLIKRQERRDK